MLTDPLKITISWHFHPACIKGQNVPILYSYGFVLWQAMINVRVRITSQHPKTQSFNPCDMRHFKRIDAVTSFTQQTMC